MNDKRIDSFIEYFSNKLISGKASFFIGSGISRNSGYVGWGDLLKDLASEIGLDVDRETDLITLAQYYVNKKERTTINEAIKLSFSDEVGEPNLIHNLICTLANDSIWTTNYDSLIERQLDMLRIQYSIITNDKSYINVSNGSKIHVHKIHGTYDNPAECVLTRNDYEDFKMTNDIVLSNLKSEMCTKSFLFIGYSFSDTDINHIFTKIRQIYNRNKPAKHFCIMKKICRANYTEEAEYRYAQTKEQHYIEDMNRNGIEVILVDEFSEISDLLIKIRKKVLSKNILISGCYDEENEEISRFISKLSSKLIKKGYKIVTGFGKNVGNNVVEGFFSGCYSTYKYPILKFDDVIKIVPFPFKKVTENTAEVYLQLRKNMASITTKQIIIGGIKNEKVSNGVYEEYRICKENGNIIIPIYSTCGAAKQIWDEEYPFWENDSNFMMLKTEFDDEKVIDAIFNILNKGE